MNGSLDLGAYLARIGLHEPPAPTAEGLFAVHRAHALTIPFENLDILLGRGIRLDLASLQAKLVAGRRGGYCFEQNALLQHALVALGFDVTPLAARVRVGGRVDGPRTHMLLSVRADGVDWLADAGFGAGGLLEPLPIAPGSGARQGAWEYRVVEDGRERVLESRTAAGWGALYGFTLEPQLPSDYVVGNHYTSTHPDSSFTRTLTAQRIGFDAQWVLRGETLTERRADLAAVETRVDGPDDLLAVLAGRFGLDFPPGTRFRPLHG